MVGDQILLQDTVWRAADGPFLVQGTVQIGANATLTIEEGAEVAVSKTFQLEGTLNVAGTAEHPVAISTSVSLAKAVGRYNEPTRQLKLRHTDFRGPGTFFSGSDAYMGLTIEDSTVSNIPSSSYIWYPSRLKIERNVFTNVNTLEIGTSVPDTAIRNNRFRIAPTRGFKGYNGSSQIVSWASYASPLKVEGNVFESSVRPKILEVSIDGRMNAAGNYFGSTDPAEIQQWTLDRSDDLNRKTTIPTDGALSEPPEATPAAPPTAPGVPQATATDGGALLQWASPVSDGGRPISGYVITTSPGGETRSIEAGNTSAAITGLANGTAYRFTVQAVNAVGKSAFTAASNEVTPSGVPGQIAAPSAVGGDSSSSVSWAAPSANGSPVLRYEVTAHPGGQTKIVGSESTITTVGGLANGSAYRFTVRAVNSAGSSTESELSNEVVPAGAPAAPSLYAARADRSATLTWEPADANGSPVTGYKIVDNYGRVTAAASTATSIRIDKLVNGRTYRFTIAAVNAVGDSVPSVAASTVPAGRPSTVARPTVKAGKRSAAVTWRAASPNGSPITTYKVRRSDGVIRKVKGTARSYNWSGLKKGKRYSFKIYALNSVGTSAASASSKAIKIK